MTLHRVEVHVPAERFRAAVHWEGEISDLEARVMTFMTDGEWVSPARHVAGDARLSEYAVRRIYRRLRQLGLAQHGFLCREGEHNVCGSGTWLLETGLAVRQALVDKGVINRNDISNNYY